MEKTYKTVCVHGNQFHYHLTGHSISSGQTNIIFLNGYRMPFDSWNQLTADLSEHGRLFFYNRLGIGKSSKPQCDQDGLTIISDLRALLSILKITPPYILVGHSLGGVFSELYARRYPEEIAGVVFVDCPHIDEIAEQRKFRPPLILRILNSFLKNIEQLNNKYAHSEDRELDKTISQIRSSEPFPEIPTTIISGMKKMPVVPKEAFDLHQKFQQEMLKLSPHTTHVQCFKSGHFPQISEPHIVAQSIKDILIRC